MVAEPSEEAAAPGSAWSLLRLSLVAALGGVAIGFIGGGFRRLLLDADSLRTSFGSWAHHWPGLGWVLPVVVVAACAAVARWMIRLVPVATGSGIQDVEAVWRRDVGFAPSSVIPVKFAGGLLALGSGLALGREGPTVHMGAVIGSSLGEQLGLDDDDRRTLQTALGGAGLAVAFNAPLGGSLFVFEEVARRFPLRLGLATLIGSSAAIACSWVVVGNHPDFIVGAVPVPPGWTIIVFALFGAATGLLGLAYNRLIIAGLDWFARPLRWPPELRAALVGGVVGLLLWFRPLAVGGGDSLVQGVLGGGLGLSVLAGYLLLRFFVGPWSYSAGTPGGIFAPLLAVGAVWGALVQGVLAPLIPAIDGSPGTMAIVGMAAFFAAIVRAPFTGIALIVEMTATTSLLVPLLTACFAAVLVCTALHGEPIYDTLRGRMPRDTVPAESGSPILVREWRRLDLPRRARGLLEIGLEIGPRTSRRQNLRYRLSREPAGPASSLALRAGLPFGAVMATGAASQICQLLGIRDAVQPLLWLAVAEAVFITVRGVIRHRDEFALPLRAWTRIGPPAEHAGVLTVPLGLAVITAGLAGPGSVAPSGLATASLVLTWLTGVIFVARFVLSAGRAGFPLHRMDGAWFLAPAAILGAGIASAACSAHAEPSYAAVLRWLALVAAIGGTAGYWALMPVAAAGVARHRGATGPAVLWWIWAGCGGLAAACLSKALGAKGATWAPALRAVLSPLATATWIAAAVLLVPIVVVSVRFLLGRPKPAPALPWPPTFSTAVFALGGLDVGVLAGIDPVGTLGKVAGYAALAGWAITAAWNLRSLWLSQPAAPASCTTRRADAGP